MDILAQDLYDNEIFKSSQCIWRENSLMEFFRSTLQMLGYTPSDMSKKVWRRGSKTVVVCLVDDIMTCRTQASEELEWGVPRRSKFDSNTVIITDNYVSIPLACEVRQLPTSFYGIYYHEPKQQTWNPSRRFNFAVNRIDYKRLALFLELKTRTYMLPDDLDRANLDYINFNCYLPGVDNSTLQVRKDNFSNIFLDPTFSGLANIYRTMFEMYRDSMPYCNHDLTQEQAHVSAWLNMVVETYSNNSSIISLSEKTFRALSLPVPFMIYASKYTMLYLQKLGFDTMTDIVSHNYDHKEELNTGKFGDKPVDFIYEGTEVVNRLQQEQPTQRCIDAAAHNRGVLKQMQQSWPADFAAWWPETLEKIV